MRHSITLVAACAALLLSACETTGPYPVRGGGTPPPVTFGPGPERHPLARTTAYTCIGDVKVILAEGQPTAQVFLNNGVELTLARTGLGRHYGAPPYEFSAAGSEGVFYANGKALRCRVL
jgi:hypothetical protein